MTTRAALEETAPRGSEHSWLRQAAGLSGALILSILIFYCFDRFLLDARWKGDVGAALLRAALMALPFVWLRMADLPAALRITLRTLSIAFGIYMVVGFYDVAPGSPVTGQTAWKIIPWLSAVLAVVGWFRPAAIILLLSILILFKQFVSTALGVPLSATDYRTVAEFAIYLSIGAACSALLFRHVLKRTREESDAMMEAFLVVCVGIHFGNYFWSGYQKIAIAGDPFEWVLTNPTWALSDASLLLGMHPLAHWPTLTETATRILHDYAVPLNALVLATQLGSILALARRRTMIGMTLFYDVQHLAIFFTTGIFFWKWIVLNTVIVAALARLKHSISWSTKIIAAVALLLGPQVFRIAFLGWFDTPSVNRAYLTANLEDGGEVALPSNYFFAASIWAAQMDSVRYMSGGFATGTWGATSNGETATGARDCALGSDPRGSRADPSILADYTRKHHAALLRRADAGGRVNTDAYPHHIWSTPYPSAAVRNLDVRDIVTYTWRLERICFRRVSGNRELVTDEIASELEIPLRPDGESDAASVSR